MYQLLKDTTSILRRNADGSITSFSPDPANTDYQKYLAWLAEGNEPLPAEAPTANEAQ